MGEAAPVHPAVCQGAGADAQLLGSRSLPWNHPNGGDERIAFVPPPTALMMHKLLWPRTLEGEGCYQCVIREGSERSRKEEDIPKQGNRKAETEV